MIGTGACAGFGIAFGAPISGLLFGFENMCYYFPSKTVWRTFACTMFTLFFYLQFKHWIDVSETLLEINTNGIWHLRELLPFFCIGIISVIQIVYYIIKLIGAWRCFV